MTPDDKDAKKIEEWLEGHYKRHPRRKVLDPDKCAEVVDILYRSAMSRAEEERKNAATTEAEDREPGT
jgi:hypothetical protein